LKHRSSSVSSGVPVIAEGLFSYELGGSERVGADIALECLRRGYRVVCFAFYASDGPIRSELESAGIECFDLNYLSRMRFVRRITYPSVLSEFFRRNDVQAAHIHHCTSLILGARAARMGGVRQLVLTEHSLRELERMPSYRRQSRRACRLADAVTVVHPSFMEFFTEALEVPSQKLHYIPNGVRLQEKDPARRARLRGDIGLSDDEFAWFFAGRLAPVKDLATLIRAFSIARARSAHRIRLVVIGSGTEQASLEQVVESLELRSAVTFLGARSDVPSLLSAADGFAMSSLSEGLPMVLLEAMAAGVPCVATAVGGIPEFFADGSGLLVPAASPAELAEGLLLVMADAKRRALMSQVAFAKVAAKNDLDRVVDRYLGLFGLPPRWDARHGVSH
jgi:glycosyltransferase involved in cell wall biosynthesis